MTKDEKVITGGLWIGLGVFFVVVIGIYETRRDHWKNKEDQIRLRGDMSERDLDVLRDWRVK